MKATRTITVALLSMIVVVLLTFPAFACGYFPQYIDQSKVPSPYTILGTCLAAPTELSITAIRSPEGLFKASRGKDSFGNAKYHQGVDIAVKTTPNACRQNTADRPLRQLAIYAVADGTVAYSQTNGTLTTGLGFTVIIDHGNGYYSLYAHMGFINPQMACPGFSNAAMAQGFFKTVGVNEPVAAGQTIGYIGRFGGTTDTFEGPTGNAVATSEPAMLHFEFFHAPIGKRSSGGPIRPEIDVNGHRGTYDPTPFLNAFKYEYKIIPEPLAAPMAPPSTLTIR